MRIKKILIENFGIYDGVNEFIFPYNPSKKVSLIIGKNGSGKTTLLNAIKTAFYGSMLHGTISITQPYNDYVLNFLNKKAMKTEESNYSVALTFISNIIGFDGEYTIERRWYESQKKISEVLIIYKEDAKLLPLDAENFLESLHRAFPLDLFELFFFDGEKIDQLGILNNKVIDLIETAINIDLYKNLKSDLENYAARKSSKNDLKKLEEHKQNYLMQIQELEKAQLDIKNSIKMTESQLQVVEKELNQLKKYAHSLSLDSTESKINDLSKQIETLRKEIKTHYIELTPYSILHAEIQTLIDQLKQEESFKNSKIIVSAMSNDLKNYIGKSATNISSEAIDQVVDIIKKKFNVNNECSLIHKISTDEYYTIKNIGKNLLDYRLKQTLLLKKQLNRKYQEVNKLKKQLYEAQDSEYKANLEKLLKLQDQYTLLSINKQQFEKKYENIVSQYNQCKAELKKLESKIWQMIKDHNVDNVLLKLNNVIDRYLSEVRHKKLKAVGYHTLKMFSTLIRKDDFITKIHFTDERIQLEDFNGNIFDHSNLSAGEKQLFVLSILFAIIQISERKVPLVFDTLLGRLDKSHKGKIIADFISQCPDQVLILATDVEIDEEFRSVLSPQVNQSYEIDFSKSNFKIKLLN